MCEGLRTFMSYMEDVYTEGFFIEYFRLILSYDVRYDNLDVF